MVVRVVQEGLARQSHGLLSVSLFGMLWAASTGMHAIIRRINRAYHVSDARGFFRNRVLALALSVVFGAMTLAAFSLVVLGGILQDWIGRSYGTSDAVLLLFAAFRWVMIVLTLILSFAIVYRFGPNVERTLSQFTSGVVAGVTVLVASSVAFTHLASSLLDYSLIYGSIGAIIVTMVWLYVVGWVILLGAELNALLDYRAQTSNAGMLQSRDS